MGNLLQSMREGLAYGKDRTWNQLIISPNDDDHQNIDKQYSWWCKEEDLILLLMQIVLTLQPISCLRLYLNMWNFSTPEHLIEE